MKILGYEIPVKSVPDHLGSQNMGQWSILKKHIIIDEALAPNVRDETVLHEVIEAINQICDLRLEHPKISTLSAVLHQVLVDNGGNISKWK